jgi:hypothetical protein
MLAHFRHTTRYNLIGKGKAAIASCGRWCPKQLTMLSRYFDFGRWVSTHGLRRKDAHQTRWHLFEFVNRTVLANGAIDFFEFGVWQGASLTKWTELNRHGDSRFYGFDSFEGLPEAWEHLTFSDDKGKFDLSGKPPLIRDLRVQLVKGWFQDTLPPFLKTYSSGNRLVLHLDADLYSSTLFVLTQFTSYIRPGTILLFDDFSSTSTQVFRAFTDYLSAYPRKYRLLGHSGSCFDQMAFEIVE